MAGPMLVPPVYPVASPFSATATDLFVGSAAALTTYTFSPVNIGPEDPDRQVVFFLKFQSATTRAINSVTINGTIAATVLDSVANNNNIHTATYVASIPTGTTCSVVMVLSASATANTTTCAAFSVINGLYMTSDYQTGGAGTGALTGSTVTQRDGAQLCYSYFSASATATWAGAAEQTDVALQGSTAIFQPTIGGDSSVSVTPSASAVRSLRISTWAPAVYPGPSPIPLLAQTDNATLTSGAASATKTSPAMAIGAAGADRYVIVGLQSSGAAPSTVTIGGVAASPMYSPSAALFFYGALVPTGTTAVVVCVQTTSTASSLGWGCNLFTLRGYQSAVPVLTDTDSASGVINTPFAYLHTFSPIPTDVALLCVCNANGGTNSTGGTLAFSSVTPAGYGATTQPPQTGANGAMGLATVAPSGAFTTGYTTTWSGTGTTAPTSRASIMGFR